MIRTLDKTVRLLPPITYSDAAVNGLSPADSELVDAYFAEVKSFWVRTDYAVTAVNLDISVDREENVRTIVVAHSLAAEADEALQYWDAIGDDLDQWTSGEQADLARRALDLISTNVLWRE